jgi:PAS domain S-box-containing protein
MTNQARNDRPDPPIGVLLIETDPAVAASIGDALRHASPEGNQFEVMHFPDPVAGRAALAEKGDAVAFVLLSGTDIGRDIFEAHRRLRQTNDNIPIVLLLNPGQEDIAATALESGFEHVVVRDTAGGYLKWLPALITNALFRAGDPRTVIPDRLAIIVQSDPESDEYKRAEQTLRDREGFWNTLVENPFDYIVLVDRKGTVQYLSIGKSEISYSDVIGKRKVFDYVLPEQRDGVRKTLGEVFSTGRPNQYESYAPVVERWFTNIVGPIYQDEEVIGASIFSRDITGQKRIETELKESERRFRQLAETIRDVFYIFDPVQQKALYVSPAYEEVYGRPVETIYENALAWLDTVHPEDRSRVESGLEAVVRSQADQYRGQGYRIAKPDGSIRWVQHRAYAIRDEEGRPVQIAGVITDVTAAAEAAERVRESEQKFRTLVDQASDAIFLTDLDGKHVDMNESASKMFGYNRDELLGMGFRDLVLDEDLAKDPPELDRLAAGELVIKQRKVRRKDGSVFPVEGSFQVRSDGLIQAIIRDITDRKLAEEALVKANEELRRAHVDLERRVEERTRELEATSEAFERARRLASIGTLAAGIAHEINNPIGSILMAADMALYSIDDPKEKKEVEEALYTIKDDAKRAGRIVKTVLQLSRQEVSRKWPHDLSEVALRARDITRRAAETNRVTVETDLPPDLPKILVNPTEIEQVFVNVISNAIESSQPGQTVFVRLSSDDHFVRAVFEDEGRGMTKEEVDRVFDPFFTTRQNEGGTGLGMSLTHSIVHLHDGKIDIQSKPGEGTRVTISFPIVNPPEGASNGRDDR